ncbi:adenosine deaminase [Luteipulveratus flavus]|uniref:Adenosine deaminase n=1 Tax=Luteipulveratus flavus TaxID=3031728 RepID=A0ABT6CAS9_9MICO|nr:adenosine deaminase [Luteipulveratus sp. YIM 133296]MDF8265988.1 adenosine deaminase [Luteipulveratus sp. YIM 133296]
MSLVEAWVADLPKVELHVHHIGATAPHTVAALAARYPDAGVPSDLDALERFFAFTDFAHFLRVYAAVSRLLRTPEDVYELTIGNLLDLARQNVRYAEVTVTPNGPLACGVPRDGLVEALDAVREHAAREYGLVVGWILDIPGHPGPPAEVVMDLCEHAPPEGLVALGLGGPETPRPQFADYFARGRALGLPGVPHAGEAAGPASVRSAVEDLHAVRIGHGIRAMEDPRVVALLRERAVHLEVCPTSNVRTRVVDTLEEHPLPAMLAAGLEVSISSDDPPMFGTTLTEELLVAARLVGANEVPTLLGNAIDASFAPNDVKRRYRSELRRAPGPAVP